ncbi:hypothetical protein A6R68_18093, partial [Neotoma lepida]
MAEAAQPSGSQGTEVTIQIQQPAERARRTPGRRGPRSVLRVSQLLLRAIAGHPRLTLAVLKRELGNAGYEVRRKISRHFRESTRAGNSTLLRVSGSDAAGYFRVWKVSKPKRKGGRSRLPVSRRSSRKTLPISPRSRRPRSSRKAARKARDVWKTKTRVSKAKTKETKSTARSRATPKARSAAGSRASNQVCARTKEQACARAKEQTRARTRAQERTIAKEEECTKAREQACMGVREEARVRAMDNSRGRPSREDAKPRSKDERRPSSKSSDQKRQEPQKLVKRTTQKPAAAKADSPSSSGQRKARTKSSTKSQLEAVITSWGSILRSPK